MVKATKDMVKLMASELAQMPWVTEQKYEWLASQLQKALQDIDKAESPMMKNLEPGTVFKVKSRIG